MRYGYIKLINYKRIYNGLGIKELYVDFKKSNNKIILIKGGNGTGKSSFIEYLNLFPDSNESFIDNQPAEKHLELIDNENIYHIQFFHDLKSNGARDVSKIFIQKNGVEMNPNGNVSSYKEYLEFELKLDSNFSFLSKVGIEDKGIVEKTPTNRKKYIISLISKLDTYNDMNKTFSKRSSIFKSMINRLISKIENIGDRDKLINNLSYTNKKLEDMIEERKKAEADLHFYSNSIAFIDPSKEIENKYLDMMKVVDDYTNSIRNIELSLIEFTETKEFYSNQYIETNKDISELEANIKTLEKLIENNLSIREEKSKELLSKSTKLKALEDEYGSIDIKINILKYKEKLNKLEDLLKEVGFNIDNINISQDEFIIAINTLNELKSEIDILQDSYNYSIIQDTVDNYMNEDINILKIENENSVLLNEVSETKVKLAEFYIYLEDMEILKDRPKNCKIDDCKFIQKALIAKNYEPDKLIPLFEEKLNELYDRIRSNNEYISKFKDIHNCKNDITHLIRKVQSFSNIFIKIPNLSHILDNNYIYDKVKNKSSFEEVFTLYDNISDMNIISEYHDTKRILYELNNELKIFESKSYIIEELKQDVSKLSEEVTSMSTKLDEYRATIFSNTTYLEDLRDKTQKIKNIISQKESLEILRKEKDDYIFKFKDIKNDIDKINLSLAKINKYENDIIELNKIIDNLIKEKGELEFAYKNLIEYEKELEEFNMKYNKIETLKKHSSYKEGIQLLYIELYLNNTIHLANELLNILYKGDIILYDFIINEEEFSIPCKIDGLMRDDISNASLSQRCMMSMIINFVLLQQSSTNFNILRLDEIDTGLDEYNRTQFVNMLYKLIHLLGIEQCIMVSHNNEINTKYTDLILFKYNENVADSNILLQI